MPERPGVKDRREGVRGQFLFTPSLRYRNRNGSGANIGTLKQRRQRTLRLRRRNRRGRKPTKPVQSIEGGKKNQSAATGRLYGRKSIRCSRSGRRNARHTPLFFALQSCRPVAVNGVPHSSWPAPGCDAPYRSREFPADPRKEPFPQQCRFVPRADTMNRQPSYRLLYKGRLTEQVLETARVGP